MIERIARNQIVLLGIGHTNAHIIRMWKMSPIPGCQLVCVSDYPISTYSGMLPGVLAGQYQIPEMEIDLVRLCRSAGCRLIVADFHSIDREKRRIRFQDRADLEYDWLSIGIGSRPSFRNVEIKDTGILEPIKPMQTFLSRLANRKRDFSLGNVTSPRCLIVGGGLGSVETALCLANQNHNRMQKNGKPAHDSSFSADAWQITLLTASEKPASGMTDAAIARIENALVNSRVRLITGQRVTAVTNDGVVTQSGEAVPADVVIWATAAIAKHEMERTGLEFDDRGFAKIKSTLQSLTDDRIFVVGDSGTLIDSPTDKAGVFAVRQGPVLWKNLNHLAAGRQTENYSPQIDFLKLVNIGNGTAIGQYKGRTFGGRFAWWLKDRIDRKFMAMYQDYSLDRSMKKAAVQPEPEQMRCLGCGGKIGGQLLHQALGEIDWNSESGVVDFEAAKSDDAAIIRTEGNEITVSTDFFASPVDDPWLAGRISVLNSVSDLYVMGAQPTAALALVQINEGHPRGQLRMLRELMAGTAHELRISRTAMAGGHTIEGERLATGFTIIGQQVLPPQKKSGLTPGDALILSKPLGSGTILAGLMKNLVDGRVYQQFSEALIIGNSVALKIGKNYKLSAMTDVTGFGLAGHLSEMLRSGNVSAELYSKQIPLFEGFAELVNQGVASTLAPGNQEFSVPVRLPNNMNPTVLAALLDPQTCGGILLGCDPGNVNKILEELVLAGHLAATQIGVIVAATANPEIVIT